MQRIREALLRLPSQEINRYIKMCIVGLSGMTVQFLIYNLLRLNLSAHQAAPIAILAAIINNFTLNRKFTFKASESSNYQKIKNFLFFVFYSIGMIIFQSYWLHLGIQYFGSGYFQENLIMISGVILGSIFNYLIYSRIIWRTDLV